MSLIYLNKATRIEGNANMEIHVEKGRIRSARFMVHEFRGFEKFVQGRRIGHVPQIISRICGLCSASHQVAGIQAVEDAVGFVPPRSLQNLRDIVVLGEWIASHSLSYFFLTMPDFVGAKGGIFELMDKDPQVVQEAYALRQGGQRITRLLSGRATHPVSLGIGKFFQPIDHDTISQVRDTASEIKKRVLRLIRTGRFQKPEIKIPFPAEQRLNLLSAGRNGQGNRFRIFDRQGNVTDVFDVDEFSDHISEMRGGESLAKIPYLTRLGFPEGILMVGPLARFLDRDGPMADEEIRGLEIAGIFRDKSALTLESFDICRILEILWAANRILELCADLDLNEIRNEVDCNVSGKGNGVIEAPRGVLLHTYLVNRGILEKARLLVATQFNNAFINLLIRDIAERHILDDCLSEEGEYLIGRCVRLFDPCLSCATH